MPRRPYTRERTATGGWQLTYTHQADGTSYRWLADPKRRGRYTYSGRLPRQPEERWVAVQMTGSGWELYRDGSLEAAWCNTLADALWCMADRKRIERDPVYAAAVGERRARRSVA